ncbi:hypothetical protein ALQ56_200464 [Pseudomonas syringae pv. papulans]|nr:hypothetical protein ALQ56_200464 [Pseudomonas syringae pv. papulans]
MIVGRGHFDCRSLHLLPSKVVGHLGRMLDFPLGSRIRHHGLLNGDNQLVIVAVGPVFEKVSQLGRKCLSV